MKHIIIALLCIIPMSLIYTAHAKTSTGVIVKVTERIPGATCVCIDANEKEIGTGNNKSCGPNVQNHLYKCSVQPGFSAVMGMMGGIIKYFTFLAGLGGVLFIVVNGIMYSMGGADQTLKDESKKRIGATLIGLILLFSSGLILNVVAPWIYK